MPPVGAPPADDGLAGARHLRALAREPRPAGGDAERRARAYCADRLREAGFEVGEEPFTYSSLPGRFATPLAGASAAAILLLAGHLAYRSARPAAALALLLAGAAAIAVGGWWLGTRGVIRLRAGRAAGVNLVATRGTPRVWLVAHLDSKSQPVPIALRALGIVAVAVVWLAAAALASAQAAGLAPADAWPWLTAAGVAAALPVMASTVGARSPGALDNASGVAAVLVAAHLLPADAHAGVLLTSAEELGLAGARAWVRGRPAAVALNCDGVDDAGTLTCMYSGRAPGALLDAVRDVAGDEVRVRRLLPGILVDGVALADAGWDVITVSRGTLRTLARIHTAGDVERRLGGTGIEAAGALLARLARAVG